ncbi:MULTISPECIES: MerR family transcriptional regulator [unclassified Mesorhizobium]|uniref:MerR family transcriptional regulator n=1 Tax=unclassified Mesorhizobium TaxID=325217 RepID=UPI001126F089|nr:MULTISPECIES: MerR family transcriptional regulator [unclassified Mesorhizobium]TPJ50625.1 MerR family transcriptional regulator [Mesorhizobium sp. B2-6-4]TPM14023.1 MerR family transcriptional regulator [Mesorhizobium sp. B2-3-6]
MEYTLSDLTEITGAKRRTLQLWAEAGVILTDDVHGGTGTYRRYSRQEALIACLMVPFHRLQMSIGQLALISNGIRGQLNGEGDGKVYWTDIEASIAGAAKCYLIVSAFDGADAVPVSFYVPRPSAKPGAQYAGIGAMMAMHESEPSSISLTLLVNTHVKALR